MKRSLALLAVLSLLLLLLLGGCGLFGGTTDETRDWSAQKLYSEAKDNLDSSNWATAIDYYEKLQTRFPFGRFAQQAQLDIAYAYYRQSDSESAIAACDRFIKLYP